MIESSARRVLLLLICVAWALHAVPAQAGSVKVLFVAKEATPFSARVRAEIEAMGFEIVSADVLDEQGHSAASAAAYVLETPPPRRVELWLQNPASGRLELSTVLESSDRGASQDDAAPETVRASEQLRAFFQPLRAREAASEVPAPAPPPALADPVSATPSRPAPPPPRALSKPARVVASPHFFEGLALAIPLEPGSAGADALLRGGWWALPRWGVGAKLGVPLLASNVRSADNSASVSTTLFGSELSLLWVDARALRLIARAGFAVAWLRAVGQATPPYTSRSDNAWAALPSLATELGLRLSERSRLCLGAELGLALPQLEITFAGRRVATWGRPLGLLSAGVNLDL